MAEMQERIARALAKATAVREQKDAETADRFAEVVWQDFLPMAHLVITEMKEPDDAMQAAGAEFFEEGPAAQNRFAASIVYGAMVGAALGEPSGG